MLNRVVAGLFARKTDYPLADHHELEEMIGELPGDNAFKALDEIAGSLESLKGADFSDDRLFEAMRRLSTTSRLTAYPAPKKGNCGRSTTDSGRKRPPRFADADRSGRSDRMDDGLRTGPLPSERPRQISAICSVSPFWVGRP